MNRGEINSTNFEIRGPKELSPASAVWAASKSPIIKCVHRATLSLHTHSAFMCTHWHATFRVRAFLNVDIAVRRAQFFYPCVWCTLCRATTRTKIVVSSETENTYGACCNGNGQFASVAQRIGRAFTQTFVRTDSPWQVIPRQNAIARGGEGGKHCSNFVCCRDALLCDLSLLFASIEARPSFIKILSFAFALLVSSIYFILLVRPSFSRIFICLDEKPSFFQPFFHFINNVRTPGWILLYRRSRVYSLFFLNIAIDL